jgi:hypothetical protein
MRERRKFYRYDVSGYPRLKAGTFNGPIGERLMTVSIGGCGFWSPADACNFVVGERVKIALHCEGFSSSPLEVRGEVLYILPHPFEAEIGRFYGIRFFEEYQKVAADLMDELDNEFRAGKISMA